MTLAPMLYRASPVDHLRTVSSPHLGSGLDKFSNPISFGSRGTSPLSSHAVSATEISRPSSTSTQGSHSTQHLQLQNSSQNISTLPQGCHSLSLPGLSALASIASAPSSQLRSFSNHATPSRHYATIAGPAPASLAGNTPPVCQNCQTSTTPLWRRDELGSVLCNACGLFLKLHGRPRPISLKTDVIKSRNRVKSTANGQRKRPFEGSVLSASAPEGGIPLSGMHLQRRSSQKLSSAASDRSHSPISRTNTPSSKHDPNIAPPHLFDGVSLNDHSFQASPSLPSLQLSHHSPGSNTSLNDRHLEPPHNMDHLFTANSQLKTRVNELELINIMRSESEARLQRELDAVRKSEEELKRRIRQLEQRLDDSQDHSSDSHPAKRTRLSDPELYR